MFRATVIVRAGRVIRLNSMTIVLWMLYGAVFLTCFFKAVLYVVYDVWKKALLQSYGNY